MKNEERRERFGTRHASGRLRLQEAGPIDLLFVIVIAFVDGLGSLRAHHTADDTREVK